MSQKEIGNFATFINETLNTVDGQDVNKLSLTAEARKQINACLFEALNKVGKLANLACKIRHDETFKLNEMKFVVCFMLGEHSEDVIKKMNDAIESYNAAKAKKANQTDKSGKKTTLNRRAAAGLNVPPERLTNYLRGLILYERVSEPAKFAIGAYVNYIIRLILTVSSEICLKEQKARISVSHIYEAVRSNNVLDKIYHNVTLPGGCPHENLPRRAVPKKKTVTRGTRRVSEKKASPEKPKAAPEKQKAPKAKATKAAKPLEIEEVVVEEVPVAAEPAPVAKKARARAHAQPNKQ